MKVVNLRHLGRVTIGSGRGIISSVDVAPNLAGIHMQHWDIALCQVGPILLEQNVEGSLDLHQIAAQRGIYDKELKKCIASSSQELL